MELDVSKGFLKPDEAFPFEAEVVLPPQEVNGETVSFDPVALQGTYTVYDGTVKLEGELETAAHARCALCMQPADFPVHVKFSEDFRKDADEMEEESFRFEGKKVPLDHMTLTLVVLELPMRFECREGCPGSEELKQPRKLERRGSVHSAPLRGVAELARTPGVTRKGRPQDGAGRFEEV